MQQQVLTDQYAMKRTLVVYYEDLLRDVDGTMRKVHSFLTNENIFPRQKRKDWSRNGWKKRTADKLFVAIKNFDELSHKLFTHSSCDYIRLLLQDTMNNIYPLPNSTSCFDTLGIVPSNGQIKGES